MTFDDEYNNIETWATAIHDDGEPIQCTVREFLGLFRAKRRGAAVVEQITDALNKFGLTTEPNFESVYIDSTIRLKIQPNPEDIAEDHNSVAKQVEAVVRANLQQNKPYQEVEAAYKISRLKTSDSLVTAINPNASLTEAVTLMLTHDYSQLPVMQGSRDVRGVITWQSIGSRLALNRRVTSVQDLMEVPCEIRSHESIFQAIPIIAEHQYVLVRGTDNRITGIVTSSDLNFQFQQLAEPFLQLAEIESHIRKVIDHRFSLDDMTEARDSSAAHRKIGSASDLTFGEYIRLLENPDRWAKAELPIDKKTFCNNLEVVREIRNDVMHFDPDGVLPEKLEQLRDFVRFLQRLQSMRVT